MPQSLDLDDRLAFDLTARQLAALAAPCLLAWFCVTALPAAVPLVARVVLATPLLVGGAVLAWLDIRGRSLDAWARDLWRYWRLPRTFSYQPPALVGTAGIMRSTRRPWRILWKC